VLTDPLDGVKRRAYLIATLSGLPAVFLVWISMGPDGLVANTIFSLFVLFYLAYVLALWTRAVSIRLAERTMFFGVVLFTFVHLSYVLYASVDLADVRTTITEITYTTLTVLYVVAYLIFDSRTALRISLAVFGLELFAVLAKALSEAPSGPSQTELMWVLRMHAFMGAVIALIYTSSYLKDQLLRQREMAEAMHRLAHTDQLPGVANRRELSSELQKETDKSERYERPLSIIFFDLDNFKSVNDTYGHDCGDDVLREVVGATERVLRTTDRLCRWGGRVRRPCTRDRSPGSEPASRTPQGGDRQQPLRLGTRRNGEPRFRAVRGRGYFRDAHQAGRPGPLQSQDPRPQSRGACGLGTGWADLRPYPHRTKTRIAGLEGSTLPNRAHFS
jgi:hypothetical protein